MAARTSDRFSTVRTEGAALPADLLQRIAGSDTRLDGLKPADYHLLEGEKLNEATNRAWNRLLGAWSSFKAAVEKLSPTDLALGPTRERWLLPLFQELGYGRLPPLKDAFAIQDRYYPISHAWGHVPIHLVGCRMDLDRRQAGSPSSHGLVQEFLNRSDDHLWAFVSNGLKLRILRDNIRLTRQAFVEFDLQAMLDGKVYADFALLWRLCHQSRVEAEKPADCWLERWSKAAQQQGLRVLDQLRDGVEKAIAALGRGFLACTANQALRDRLRAGNLDAQDYYRQLLRLVYRFLFLFVAEDRELLFDPKANEAARDCYTRFYSSARLRRLAERLRGTQHTDLYQGATLVLARLGNGGCAELALPALGSFLFSPDATPDLNACHLTNADLLDAIRALALTSDAHGLRPVDYRNLGAEELGSIYESLLELHPVLNQEAGTFELRTASGHERKTTGSYYTPTSLITCLLDSALDPVLDEAARKPVPETALLALKVCDPACGSGHFLIAAAHRIAKRLAYVRSGEEEPPPEALRKALRDVIGRCVFGVDLNPMAVELCKVALWMEALEPGKPLSFLDHHIQCGNSLLGATPALVARGIPDEAFEPIEGDDKAICRACKKQNHDDRRGQAGLFDDTDHPWNRLGDLATAMHGLEQESDDTLAGVRRKQERYAELVRSSGYLYGHFLADAWCAAFVWHKDRTFDYAITERILRRIERNPHDVTPWMRQEIERLAYQYQFFHWHLAFPDVFFPASRARQPSESDEDAVTGWTGGFDVVLGNPPWERIKLQEQEWFAERRPDIAAARNAAERRRMIDKLRTEDPALHRTFLDDRRKAEGESHFVRDSGRYPLCGRGDVNTYSLFAELTRNLINPAGRVGCILPTGVVTDETNKLFFQRLVEDHLLLSFYAFENEEKLFPGITNKVTFGLLTFGFQFRGRQKAKLAFRMRQVEQIAEDGRLFELDAPDLALLSPNTRTCPVFRTNRDAVLTKVIYRRVPVLLKEGDPHGNPWGIRFLRMFDMANDSGLFRTAEQLAADGWMLDGNTFRKADHAFLPLYEAKMFWHFNHRFGDYSAKRPDYRKNDLPQVTNDQLSSSTFVPMPQSWVDRSGVEARLGEKWSCQWLLGWRDITGVETIRTSIASVLPRVGVGHTAPLILPNVEPVRIACLYANLCSFVFDYATRQKVGRMHLTYGVLNQLPVLPPSAYSQICPWSPNESLSGWLFARVLELAYTAWDLRSFAEDCGYDGPPFRWDEKRRFQLRCELDAAYFLLYFGVGAWQERDNPALLGYFPTTRDAVGFILETFPILRRKDVEKHGRYQTKEAILAIYDALAEASRTSRPYQTLLDPPPADPRVAHPPREQVPSPAERRPPPAVITRPREPIDPALVIKAFAEVRDGMSPDYVIACPEANRDFLDVACKFGVNGAATEINLALLNARKAGRLKGMPSEREYRLSPRVEPWTFVSEWAMRHLQRELVRETDRLIALDELLCNPDHAARFDELAARIKPGFKPLEYRWAALGLRKKGKARPAPDELVVELDRVLSLEKALDQAPRGAGIYLIRAKDRPLYVNHAAELQEQVRRHAELAGEKLIPDWLLDNVGPVDGLSYAYLTGMRSDRLREIRITCVARYRPWLNLLDQEGPA